MKKALGLLALILAVFLTACGVNPVDLPETEKFDLTLFIMTSEPESFSVSELMIENSTGVVVRKTDFVNREQVFSLAEGEYTITLRKEINKPYRQEAVLLKRQVSIQGEQQIDLNLSSGIVEYGWEIPSYDTPYHRNLDFRLGHRGESVVNARLITARDWGENFQVTGNFHIAERVPGYEYTLTPTEGAWDRLLNIDLNLEETPNLGSSCDFPVATLSFDSIKATSERTEQIISVERTFFWGPCKG